MKTYADRLASLEAKVAKLEQREANRNAEAARPPSQSCSDRETVLAASGHKRWCVLGLPDYRKPTAPLAVQPRLECNCGAV